MKIIIAPDKFKGSLSSFEACNAIAAGIAEIDQQAEIHLFPMADGGDGFAKIMQHYLHTAAVSCQTKDPLGRDIEAEWQWNEATQTAFIELAAASGLVLLNKKEQNPLHTSTYGTGLQLKDAIEKGAKKIVLGIGGSATNDAGTGILAALGFHFLDKEEKILKPVGKNLVRISKIIPPHIVPPVSIEIVCDVQNVLFGPQGAAYIYGPQKGANRNDVTELDNGLKDFSSVIKEQTGKDVSYISGTGAAGGIAAGLMGFFDITLVAGTDMMIACSELEKQLPGADLLITGEGKIDEQSTQGKVVGTLAALGKKYNVPVVAYCGLSELTNEETVQSGLYAVIAIADNETAIEHAIKNAASLLQQKTAITIPSLMA